MLILLLLIPQSTLPTAADDSSSIDPFVQVAVRAVAMAEL
jgi:hypothetical protein